MERLRVGLGCVVLTGAVAAQGGTFVLDPRLHHLGDSRVTTWEDVPADPEGTSLELTFAAPAAAGECVLALRYRDVDEDWTLRINDVEIGRLERDKQMRLYHVVVAPGVLRATDNRLSITTAKTSDDIAIGNVTLFLSPLRDVLKLQPLAVEVRHGDGHRLPAKITVARAGELTDVYYAARATTAVRKGIVYTADGSARLELPPGDYEVIASRGTEWGVARRAVTVAEAAPGTAPVPPITLTIEREVDTRGYVAADTHVHTYTFSGHGDASVAERMVTLAAEGVELAIATDHNHNTDYRPTQAEMGLHEHFTAVVGNEVTTEVGHFNAFPLDPTHTPPDYRIGDWVRLIDGIRAAGAKVVVLNHPRWPQLATGPLGTFRFDRLSGDYTGQAAMPFDAMELANSTALLDDPMYVFVDWFAMLNHGEHVTAVGSSDSHTVGDPVGQGRTYVRSATDVPADIDVDAVCESFRRGTSSISLGIFCTASLADGPCMGRTVPAAAGLTLRVRVAAPAWVRPHTARLFCNGRQLAEAGVPVVEGRATDTELTFAVPPQPSDAWLVGVVVGAGVSAPFWRTERPYTLAATNPLYLDGDGDGRYTSPRGQAEALVERHGLDGDGLRDALQAADPAVVVQALSLARRALVAEANTSVQAVRARLFAIAGAPPYRAVVAQWLDSLSASDAGSDKVKAR